ncbi:hypothetical protein GJ496_003310 [Pomphorhynchus laevis]|nr:hypothetical protein GJ496_003310 [Pomphorhynchus laevis]
MLYLTSLLLVTAITAIDQYDASNRKLYIEIYSQVNSDLRESELEVSLQDTGRMDAAADTRLSAAYPINSLPTVLKLNFNKSLMKNAVRPSLGIRISRRGKLLYINDMHVPVNPYDTHIQVQLIKV